MKVAFLCPSVSRTGGGIFEIERSLGQSLANLHATSVEVYGPSDQYSKADFESWSPLRPQQYPFVGPGSFRYSPGLRRALVAADVDIVHLHALWMHTSIVARKWAQHWKRPYIITANGMLEPWALRNSGWKKRLALVLYERECLKGAACIQVNSRTEYESVRGAGFRNPICIIPNGVNPPQDQNCNSERCFAKRPSELPIPEGRKILLYLGRLHPKKGLANLLKAWAQSGAEKTDWSLAIAGWDQAGHEDELRKLTSGFGLLASVVFLGPQFGEGKLACYRICDAFILPSFSEGLPMVVLEAWSHGKPVLMTDQCNLPEGFHAAAALRIEPGIESISDGLKNLFRMSGCERKTMGQRGLELVEKHFTWPAVAAEMHAVYEWVLGLGPKPACVVE